MTLNLLEDRCKHVLVEVDHAVKVELGAEQVEKDILAVTLVEFGHDTGQLVEHGEGLGGVGHAGDHLPH